MKSVSIPNGILHVCESKADCPYCSKHVPIKDAERVLQNSSNGFNKLKCKGCERFIGVTSDIKGDIRSYELPNSKHN